MPGAIVIDRNVLEWRLDPACPHHIPEISDYDTRIVIVCNEGYQSSLAAANSAPRPHTATDLHRRLPSLDRRGLARSALTN